MFRFRPCPLRRSREFLNDVANVVGLLASSSAWRFVRGGYPCSKNQTIAAEKKKPRPYLFLKSGRSISQSNTGSCGVTPRWT